MISRIESVKDDKIDTSLIQQENKLRELIKNE